MKLLMHYLKVHFMSQMSYKKSFMLMCIGQFLLPFATLIAMLLLFQRFETLLTWNVYETVLCYGIINFAFAISECLFRGFDSFSIIIREGNFDRIMLRPRHTILQVLGSKFEFSRFGRMLNGLVALIIALSNLHHQMNLFKYFVIFMMIISATVVFGGILMLGAAMCFKTIQGLEIINLFSDGGREMAGYPLDIYKTFVKKFFTFVVPFGLANYYPLLYVLDKSNNIVFAFLPLLTCLFFIPCYFIWQLGVKHYASTGS